MKKISVFGLGYVGSITAACFANSGYQVTGVDINTEKVKFINAGKSPVVEPGLGTLVAKVAKDGMLCATTSCDEAVRHSDIAFICVGTPSDSNGALDLSGLKRVCQDIGRALKAENKSFTLVVRSTMLPGSMENVVVPALLAEAGEAMRSRIHVAVNPEFMREGSALKDFCQPPMTLVGCHDSETAAILHEIFHTGAVGAPFVHTEIRTAEAVKYASNAFHALKICFANEMGDICKGLGVDAQEVMRIFCMDEKLNISKAYLKPGFAFGGSCLPKDVRAILYAARHANVPLPLMDSILPANEAQIQHGIDAVLSTGKKRIGILGLSFKSDTDDLRESPLVRLVETLIGKGYKVRILDRNVSMSRLTGANRAYIEKEIPHIATLLCEDSQQLMTHAQVLVIGNNDKETRQAVERDATDQIIVDLTRETISRLPRSRVKAA